MKTRIRNILAVLLAVVLCCGMAFAENPVTVYIDGETVDFDVAPRIIDGRTMVPIRAIFEALGATVVWHDETKTAVAKRNDFKISLTMGDPILRIGDSDFIQMDVVPVNIDGRILVPARFAGEAFSCVVDWDNTNRNVVIYSKEYLDKLAG